MSERPTGMWRTAYHAAWIFPVSSPPIRDGAVLVEDGIIRWVGPRAKLPEASHPHIVELGNALLAPGLINAHTHLDLTALRGLLDGEPFFGWIRAVIDSRNVLTAAEQMDAARAGIAEGLAAGVTTFADTSPTSVAFDTMRDMGVRGIAYIETFGPDPAQCAASLGSLRALVAALRPLETPLVRLGVSPHAPYSVSDALYAATAEYARAERLPLATHIAESEAETAYVAAGRGPFAELLRGRGIAVAARARTPVAMLNANGVLGPDTLLIHCVRCDPADIAMIARSDAAVVTCPYSNRYFGHGDAPVRALGAAGVRAGVGSDSLASNTRIDPLAEAYVALGASDTVWPEAWELATLGGARALGLGDTIGSIEQGKSADLAAFTLTDVDAASPTPPYAVPDSRKAVLTIVAGAERVRGHRLVGDDAGISIRAKVAATKLREWRRHAPPA